MKSQEIRDKFLRFFEKRGHKAMPSSSLITEDETVLFTTAGMQQFKKYYLNPKEAPSSRIMTIQKCFRINDIEEVGDKTHLSFFEMMGNFSFDDYFKKEAISWAWEFLTEKEWLGIDKKRISATYFKGDKGKGISEDKESLEILKKVEDLSKIEPQGFEDNFWSLGIEGSPGGPTVEFYIDGVEIWNLVFNEYIFEKAKYKPSKFKGIDTGMGFERLAVILQSKDSVFETDLFLSVIRELEKMSTVRCKEKEKEFRIIADHIKASVFLIRETIVPAKLDRGYVLRRLLRRSMVYAKELKLDKGWYTKLIKKVSELYNGVYEENSPIKITDNVIITIIQHEEEKFRQTLDNGMKEFDKWYKGPVADFIETEEDEKNLQGKTMKAKKTLPGFVVFRLVTTFGFPIESIREIAAERGIKVDEEGFKSKFEKHQEISRVSAEKKFKGGLADESYETTKLHTTAHLLLQALREVLGEHVVQKGSNITAERLRFDFSHPEKLADEQIKKVEDLVNKRIRESLSVSCGEMTVEEAKKQGAMGVFEERYGDKVKIYSVGSFSKEICGGPHIKNTSELGEFKIKKEESVGAGIRRIKAVLL